MNQRAFLLPLLSVLAIPATAQHITLFPPAGPVAPGATVLILGVNTSGTTLLADGRPPRVLRADGRLVSHSLIGCGSVGDLWGPGGVGYFQFRVPVSGRGAAGSFVVRFALPDGFGGEAIGVVRVDVAAASPTFPTIVMYPTKVSSNGASHWVDPATNEQWEIANTSAQGHTFTAGDTIDVLAPGGTVPLARLSLAGTTVVPRGVTRLPLPLATLPAGPYSVQTTWTDPAVGPTTVEHGVLVGAGPQVDLQLPDGPRVPLGGSIEARLVVDGPNHPLLGEPSQPFAAAMCLLPGTTPLGAAQLPLVFDPVLLGSLATGAGGVLQNNLGATARVSVHCAHVGVPHRVVEGIVIRHPNLPGIAGLRLRFAAATFDLVGARFLASQPEWITFQ